MDIAGELASARAAVRETNADPRIGWAWMRSDYRASPTRAFRGATGPLTVDDAGMPALEAAMDGLLGDQRVLAKWREEDLWDVVLSLLAASRSDERLDLAAAVRLIVKPKAVRHVAALANVTWEAGSATLGGVTLAHLRSDSDAATLAGELDLDARAREAFSAHARRLFDEFGDHVLATATSPRQGELAHTDFTRAVEDMFGLTLMLSKRLEEHGIFSLRGATNRPGIRGTTLDHKALSDLLADKGAGELRARILRITGWGAASSIEWSSVDPLPLDRLLDSELRPVIGDLLDAQDSIAQRLRLAARWYARAFWAIAEDDAALAVSVALDAMLTGKDALPGAVSKSRFAFLERDVRERNVRFERYESVYQVRSAITHGGDASRRLAEIGGARSMLADARWVAEGLLDLRQMSKPMNDAAFRELWAAMQWGALPWITGSSS